MENNNEKQEFEFSIISFLKIFKGKVKMLVALGLIAAILGGVLGALMATKKVYGNTLTFYLPTPEKSGYSTSITLLESDRFTENVLIGTRPVEYTDAEGNKTNIDIPDLQYSEEDEKKIIEYYYAKQSAMEKMSLLKKDLKKLPAEINLLKSTLDEKQSAYTILHENYKILLGDTALTVEAKAALEAIKSDYDKALSEYDAAQKAYSAATTSQANMKNELSLAENAVDEANEESEKILAPYLEVWRNQPENKAKLSAYREGVKFRFTAAGLESDKPEEIKAGTTYNFIYVGVSIPKDQALANDIINNILNQIDSYLIPNMAETDENDLIECKHLSYGSAKDVSDVGLISNSIIYALIVFAIVEVLACGCIVISHIKKTFFRDAKVEETAVESKEETEEEIKD